LPQRRGQPRSELSLFDPDSRAQPGLDDWHDLGSGHRRRRGSQCRDVTAYHDPPGPVGRTSEFLRGDPAQRPEKLPLIVVRFQRGQIEKHRRAVTPRGLEQRRGDQVPDPARREQVLRGNSRS
jgi:hypothetical protein